MPIDKEGMILVIMSSLIIELISNSFSGFNVAFAYSC